MLIDVEEVIKNPKTVFDYSYFVDKSPTKYVGKTDKITSETPVINEKEEILLTPMRTKTFIMTPTIKRRL